MSGFAEGGRRSAESTLARPACADAGPMAKIRGGTRSLRGPMAWASLGSRSRREPMAFSSPGSWSKPTPMA
jgi:hypothetical protein